VLLPVTISADLEARFADLRSHRRDSMEFDMALRTVQQDMLLLKSRISDSFDSPMQHVVQLLAQLPKLDDTPQSASGGGSNTRAVASSLRQILMDMYEALKTANLYEPDFNQLAENAGTYQRWERTVCVCVCVCVCCHYNCKWFFFLHIAGCFFFFFFFPSFLPRRSFALLNPLFATHLSPGRTSVVFTRY
jgi:hypothetical protein